MGFGNILFHTVLNCLDWFGALINVELKNCRSVLEMWESLLTQVILYEVRIKK